MNFHGALSGSQHSEVGVRVLRVYGSFFVGGGGGRSGRVATCIRSDGSDNLISHTVVVAAASVAVVLLVVLVFVAAKMPGKHVKAAAAAA